MVFTNILFPVDFSDAGRRMAPFVASVALRAKAPVTLLHVLDLRPGVSREASGYLTLGEITSLRRQVEQDMRTAFSSVFTEVPASFCIGEGDPADTIARHAAENQIDLVCMPTHGCGRFRHLLLGSVTAKVLDDVDIPVLTGAHHQKQAPPPAYVFRNILCCVDLSKDSIRVVGWAARLAREFDAQLELLHALPAVDEPTANRGVLEVNRYHKDLARQKYAQLRGELDMDRELHLVGGSVAQATRQTAIERGSDLIVIGRGVMRERLGRMRTNTYAIIRESPCPVLSV